jgi:hypothetical protein
MNPSSMKRMSMGEYGDDFGFAVGRRDSVGKLDMIGGAEMLDDEPGNSKAKSSKNSGGLRKRTNDH